MTMRGETALKELFGNSLLGLASFSDIIGPAQS
jgi:hypothetical protein